MPQCPGEKIDFGHVGRHVIEADFSGGDLSSEVGAMLLRLGWEDVCDHNALRADLPMQTAVGRDQALAHAPRAAVWGTGLRAPTRAMSSPA
jgi:hypothetical protein